ncbi:hypothetical protein E0K93_20625 [Puniceibacterium sp. HSS470]|nr:hypothetical protein E0K93_20625 [Puniceibacterium sp. HSS470]
MLMQIEPTYSSAADRLFALLDDVRAVTDNLSEVAEFGGLKGQEKLARSSEMIEQHLLRVENQFLFLSETADKMLSQATDLRNQLKDQSSDIKAAAMIATNARVVSCSIMESDGSLANFASDVSTLLNATVRELANLKVRLFEADAQLIRMLPEIRSMKLIVSGHTRLRLRLNELVASVRAEELEMAAQKSERDLDRMSKELEIAVSLLQVGDASRQRLEHAQAILEKADEGPAAWRQVIVALAVEQVLDTREAVLVAHADLLPELRRISDSWHRSLGHMAAIAGSGVGHTLSEVANLVAAISANLTKMSGDLGDIAPGMSVLAEYYGSVAVASQATSLMDQEMHLLGVNAILVSGRIGQQGQAMMEVSRQLRDATAQIGSKTSRIVELAALQEMNANIFSVSLTSNEDLETHARAASLEKEVQQLRETLEIMTATMEKIGSGDPVLEAQHGLEGFVDSMNRVFAPIRHMAPMAVTDPGLQTLLATLRATYTMQSERVLHDRLFPEHGSMSVPEEADDVFFG